MSLMERKRNPLQAGTIGRAALLVAVVAVAAVVVTQSGDLLSIQNLARQETQLKEYQSEHPLRVLGAAFLIYVGLAALSLPGAAAMTLVYGWYFGFVQGVILVSFASTAGATLAFLMSRFLFRDAVQKRFGDRLIRLNQSLEKEGAFYLFALRLVPAIPFFVINAVMGLTPIRVRTFWWVSQLGMLGGTMVYVYAGASVPNLQTLAEQGIYALFSPTQLVQIICSLALLGVFPFLIRWGMQRVARHDTVPQATTPHDQAPHS